MAGPHISWILPWIAEVEFDVDVQVSVNSNFNQINYIQIICQAKLEQIVQLNLNS